MTTSMGSVPPPSPLSYTGEVVVPYINRTFDPTTAFNTFSVPTVWVNTATSNAFLLVSKAGGVAIWVPIGGIPGGIQSITTPDAVVVTPTAGNVNFLAGSGFTITGDLLTSSITFTPSGSVSQLFTADSGTATPSAGNLIITGSSTGLTTTGSGHTIGLTGTLGVAHGGTGDASFTPYAVICGGTSSTNPLQSIASVGTANQVLTSNGAGALPTFQSISSTGAFDQIVIKKFTSNDTYTPTFGMKYCIIEGVGSGGGGGGAAATDAGTISVGGGGGGGEYGRVLCTAAQVGSSQTVTIGASSAGGSAGNPGTAGNQSSVGTLLVIKGGGAGPAGAAGIAAMYIALGVAGGSGGTSSAGTAFFCQGGGSSSGYGNSSANNAIGGFGGSSYFGGGAVMNPTNAGGSTGQSPVEGYGGGGSGGVQGNSSGGVAGGASAQGLIVITEFISS